MGCIVVVHGEFIPASVNQKVVTIRDIVLVIPGLNYTDVK